MKTLNELDTSLKWYFDMHPEEKDMGETYKHMKIGDYLRQVLLWYFRAEKHLILKNQVVFTTIHRTTSPDIAVVKNVNLSEEEKDNIVSWRIEPPHRPAPSLVIEISSSGNWDKDIELDKLPARYAEFGVKEYFAFDPKGYWEDEEVGLKGWRNENGQMQPLDLVDNKIWSDELNCWVVDADGKLCFEDAAGNLLLTESEAKDLTLFQAQLRAELEAQAKELERQRAEAETLRAEQRAEAEAQAKELERQRAEAETLRAEQERQRAERLAAKLRELDIDPDKL
jgi:Uma2 family endonuclease